MGTCSLKSLDSKSRISVMETHAVIFMDLKAMIVGTPLVSLACSLISPEDKTS